MNFYEKKRQKMQEKYIKKKNRLNYNREEY